MYLLGIDENGYGPLLGPLIVTATAYKVHPHTKNFGVGVNLWHILNISKNPDDYPEKLIVTDSKKLFSRNSLKRRQAGERTVLAFFYLLFKTLPENPDRFLSKVLLNFSPPHQNNWCGGRPCWEEISLPLWLKEIVVRRSYSLAKIEERIKKEAGKLRKRLRKGEIKFLGLKSICICPFQFNKSTADKSKSYLNYLQFEKLISHFLRKKEGEFLIFADRIGGQREYLPHLKSGLLKHWDCRILEESRAVSSYELSLKEKIAVISFLQNGEERQFPVALSSLFGKYIREISIERINRFFQNYNPELKSVSGYRDSRTKDFIKKTVGLRKRLKIRQECFLRNV